MVKDKVQEIFREVFEDEELIIREDMTAEDIEDWDSLTHIQLIETIEKTFNISFTLQEIAELDTIGEFIELTEKKAGKK